MNDKIGLLSKKLDELETKVNNLNIQKFTLSNILSELGKGSNTGLKDMLQGADLQEEISYINDWIEFHSKEIRKHKAKLERLSQSRENAIKDSFGLIFEGKPAKKSAMDVFAFAQKPSVKYSASFVILLLIATSLFLLKPSTTGYAVLSKETNYSENLNLQVNENGTFNWNLKNPGDLKSLRATGSVIGNGTIKIYIEKDGKRYLIYEKS